MARADGCGTPASTGSTASTVTPVSVGVHIHSWCSCSATSPCAQTQPRKRSAGCPGLSSCHSTGQGSAGSLTHPPALEVFALAPASLRRQVPPCRCVDVLLLRHSSHSAPIARRCLSMQELPLPSCTSSRAWNQLRSSCSSFFAAFLHPPCSSFLHHSRHSQDMLLTLATSLAILSRRSRGEERKACKNWRVGKVGLKEE